MKTSNALTQLLSSVLTPAEIKTSEKLALISMTIEFWRLDHNMTQSAFAKFMGVTQAMVSKWESGEYNFSVKILAEISEHLDIPLDVLFCGEKDTKSLRQYSQSYETSTSTCISSTSTTSVAPTFKSSSSPVFPFTILPGGAA